MEKRNLNNEKELKKSNFEERIKRNPSKSSQINQKRLPWWVELLFVQIGLPDKWLIKILKTKKRSIEFCKNERKVILFIFSFLFIIGYFQPVTKYSQRKLKCQKTASQYIYEKTNLEKKDSKIIEMLTINLCNGGNEINNFLKKNDLKKTNLNSRS